MITGVGTDIVEIKRIRQSYLKYGDRFLERIFTVNELDYCMQKKDPIPSLAVRFAVKEAFVKAAHLGKYHSNTWTDVSVVLSKEGVPIIEVYNALREVVAGQRVHLSVSHSEHYATATVVLERII
ncbi:MAG: holo-ACP synthase [Bacteroidetes bacterium]|nr:holo-ACP synthase [Bacteroidota bacterium]